MNTILFIYLVVAVCAAVVVVNEAISVEVRGRKYRGYSRAQKLVYWGLGLPVGFLLAGLFGLLWPLVAVQKLFS